jgi:hypothetical protein
VAFLATHASQCIGDVVLMSPPAVRSLVPLRIWLVCLRAITMTFNSATDKKGHTDRLHLAMADMKEERDAV